MRVEKREQGEAFVSAVDRHRRRQEIEADVLEIWIVASRLLGRLTEPGQPLARRRARSRRRTARVIKTTVSRSAPIP